MPYALKDSPKLERCCWPCAGHSESNLDVGIASLLKLNLDRTRTITADLSVGLTQHRYEHLAPTF